MSDRNPNESAPDTQRDAAGIGDAYYGALFEATLDGILVVDEQGTYVDVNDSMCRLLKAPRGRLLGATFAEFIPPDMLGAAQAAFGGLKQTSVFEGEFPLRALDGTIVELEWRSRANFVPGLHFCVARDITERRRNENALGMHSRVLESMVEGVSLADENGTIVYTNPAEDAMFGYERGELVGQHVTVQNTYPPEENRRIVAEVIDSLTTDGSWFGEFSNRKKDGTPFTTFARITALDIAGKKHWVCVQEDVTERRRAMRALGEREDQLRLIMDAVPSLISYVDHGGRYQLINRAYETWFGQPLENIRGERMDEVIGTAAWEALGPHVETALAGEAVTCEEEVTYKNGVTRFVHAAYTPHLGADGAVLGIIVMVTDISERRRIENAVRASEERFRTMANNVPVMIWIANTEKLCTWFNHSWLEFTGRTMEEELGNGWAEGIHADDVDRCLEIYGSSFDARRPFAMDYRLRRQDGEYRWVVDNGVPLFGADGEFNGYIGSCVDITDRKRAEHEQERLLAREQHARQQAEEANRAKDEFLATVSHELRTPLTSMLGWARMLRTGTLDDATFNRAVETIERNAHAQAQLVEDLLDVSRIITGKLRLNVQPADLGPIVSAAVDSVRPAADAKGIRLQVVLDSGVGPVLGDPQRLQQIVWNLVSNAVKFTPKAGRVQVHLERIESHVEITVSDTGQGIRAEFLPYVFDRFRQADSTITRAHGGLGLGLAIVRHLVELHGGSVHVESAGEGRGAVFTVMLPLMIALRNGGGAARVHSAAHSEVAFDCPPVLQGMRVLVVDDEVDTRSLLEYILIECGAEVRTASSAAEALGSVEAWEPDVLVSDVGMPGEDGYALIRAVRALESERVRRMPAIAVTAYARPEDRVRLLSAGFQAHLPKPIEPAELVAVIASQTRSRS